MTTTSEETGRSDRSVQEKPTVDETSIITVALLCGLPASGKSSLAKWLLANGVNDDDDDDGKTVPMVHYIEYDAVEDSLWLDNEQERERPLVDSNGNEVEDNNGAFSREIWKNSRSKSLEHLESLLTNHSSISSTGSPQEPPPERMIIMDDNFHLRSMRREVYRVCQNQVEARPDSVRIYFVILWLDVSKEECLRRNQPRSRKVPEDVIERMSETLEPPGKEHWEQCYMRLKDLPDISNCTTNNNDNTHTPNACLLNSIRVFIFRDCRDKYAPVQPPPPPIDLEQLEEERRRTRESWLHSWDQRLRSWVGKVSGIARKDTGKANKARKQLLQRLRKVQQQEEADQDELPTHLQVTEWFLAEMDVAWTEDQRYQFQEAIQEEET